MFVLDAKDVAAALPYRQLIDALAGAFASDVEVPQRTHLDVPVPNMRNGTLLLMPAWRAGGSMGVKIATVFPDNASQDRPAVHASYFLMAADTGIPVAVLDGTELTVRRTAAASALASTYLSREDSGRLLMVGTGNLAPQLIAAHTVVRPIKEVIIWGRRKEAAVALGEHLSGSEFAVSVANDLESAVPRADIISCATLSGQPLIRGDWLQPGQHLDLVGAFKPDMREADTDVMVRSDVYVDTRVGAFSEAGEIVQAISAGAISRSDICGELSDLARGQVTGRESDTQITLFKSVGTALEDLAAAELAIRNLADDA